MQPRRTHNSNKVFSLDGGTEDNDLWVERREGAFISHTSTWEPTYEERQAIADGANIDLTIMGAGHPPVAMAISHTPLGKPPES